jgi:hypothetical protein
VQGLSDARDVKNVASRETEAELCAFLIARRFGVTPNTADYLAWYSSGGQVLDFSLEAVLVAVGKIEALFRGNFEKKKGRKPARGRSTVCRKGEPHLHVCTDNGHPSRRAGPAAVRIRLMSFLTLSFPLAFPSLRLGCHHLRRASIHLSSQLRTSNSSVEVTAGVERTAISASAVISGGASARCGNHALLLMGVSGFCGSNRNWPS